MFRWDKIPGKDDGRLRKFLIQKFGIDWVSTTKFEKIDGKTIKASTEKDSLSLKLNAKKTEVILEINDGRIDNFIAKLRDNDLNIFEIINKTRKEHLNEILTKLLDYVAWITYGYGVRPGNPLILSLILFVISIFIFMYGFGLQEPLGSITQAIYLSVFVFTSSPKTDPLTGFYGIWGMIERIAGWLLMACFLVVLAKKTLR